MMPQFLSWNLLCEMMDQGLMHYGCNMIALFLSQIIKSYLGFKIEVWGLNVM